MCAPRPGRPGWLREAARAAGGRGGGGAAGGRGLAKAAGKDCGGLTRDVSQRTRSGPVRVVCGKEHGSSGVRPRPRRAGWKQMPWPQWDRQREGAAHSFIHSFGILGHLLYARFYSECWENSKNKIKSLLLPRSVHSNASVTGISHWRFSSLSPSWSSALPAWKTNARPSAPPHLPGATFPMHLPQHHENIKLPSLSRYLERAPDAACSYTQTERRLGPAPGKADENSRDPGWEVPQRPAG